MRKANPAAGEVGIDWGEHHLVFRPSFCAIASLGEPEELVSLLQRAQRGDKSGFMTAYRALCACYDGDVDIDKLTGVFREVRGRLRFVQGAMPYQDVHVLGVKLLVNGMIGKPRLSEAKSGSPASTFDPAEYVASAVAHLGLSYNEAWDMTMLELQRVIEAKQPKKDGPTMQEAADMESKIKAIRAAKAKKERAGNG